VGAKNMKLITKVTVMKSDDCVLFNGKLSRKFHLLQVKVPKLSLVITFIRDEQVLSFAN